MLNAIIRYAITHKLVIGVATVGLIIWGVYSLKQLPIDAVPDITNNQVQIVTTAPSSGAEDIERYVTFPIEQTMATIPNIEEIRSFSRFGLSVVTIVFTEETDIYWAREQVSQRLTEARAAIPPGLGDPGLAPVSTGLGEIYQYIIKPKKGYEKEFSPAELRSVQDWVIRRQLLGIEGVADVSGFGGNLKQYEVAIKPEVLRSFNISMTDLFRALEENNGNTGGAYINKSSTTYYIRSEGLTKSLDEIRMIPVKKVDGIPILVKDLADVRYGSAVRYGALTNSYKGEAVGGIVLMLKDANASKVIKLVKERMDQIQQTLPEGVEVEVYLDRTKLVDKAIHTVSTNLIEGALIVIFILVLLLGNLRAGLIVASVIPLAMLFAVAMMNLFGVSGNLMSLGAIDFGLIVDGAVIIVEATLHHLVLRRSKHQLSRDEMNKEVEKSSSGIMKSAAFGEIIILIVYLPLLTLVGIEGKMFAPMAQTVIFAIIGAFLLSLTYVPMMASLALSRKPLPKQTFSDRLMRSIENAYKLALNAVIRYQKWALGGVIGLLLVALLLFSSLGSEFIPTLDEGDFAVELRAIPGSSIDHTVDVALDAARVIEQSFPHEVKTCVGKIGTAEIPTDPMPMEACDLMIILKDKEMWKAAHSREELAVLMQQKLLDEVPGASYSFQQPIQMRFNEMMAGAKQDVVVKVYGENLDQLSEYARHIGAIARKIDGAADVYVEEVTGLPQIMVRFNRPMMAQYGISVQQVNEVINMGFAGRSSGMVFEGEKRFDLVVRLDGNSRNSIDDLRNLTVLNEEGISVPIRQLAEVNMENGPNQIQRDDAKRRILVAFNVRGRDVGSIVDELKARVEKNVHFVSGYYPTYGGTYKNLEKARERLSLAVPAALFLILFLLYATFQSVKQAFLIFSAIPLAAIGGIFALWLRGMPFSISAGVGFIALFGVAVLNGIVLVAEFNRLKKEKTANGLRIILSGTRVRLRPVLMTAMVASLGFLPMAISSGSGAEVQKPLATVVIGGLVTATFLTLFLLPVMYRLTDSSSIKKHRRFRKGMSTLLVLMSVSSVWAQETPKTRQECIALALEKNLDVQVANLAIEQAKLDRKARIPVPRTDVTLMLGQYNSAIKTDNNITIQQSIPFPTVFARRKDLAATMLEEQTAALSVTKWNLTQHVVVLYEELGYLTARLTLYQQSDSLYSQLEKTMLGRHQAGDANRMEVQISTVNKMRNSHQSGLISTEILRVQVALQSLLHTTELIVPADADYKQQPFFLHADTLNWQQLPPIQQLMIEQQRDQAETALLRAQRLPDLSFGYFNQTLIGSETINGQDIVFTGQDRFQGFMIGTSIPIFDRSTQARMQQSSIREQQTALKVAFSRDQLQQEYEGLKQTLTTLEQQLQDWEQTAKPLLESLEEQTRQSFLEGEKDVQWMLLNLQTILQYRSDYIDLLFHTNSVVNRLNSYTIQN